MKKYIFLFLFFTNLFAQINLWQFYPSFSNFIAAEGSNNYAFYINNNSLFSIDPNIKDIQIISKINGLKGNNFTAIKYYQDKLLLGYSEGIIDVYDLKTKTVITNYDIQKSDYLNKSIQSFSIVNDTIYVITNFGIVIFDFKSLKILDTYTQFPFDNNSDLINILKYNELMYIAYKNGLVRQKQNSKYLNIKSSWEQVTFANLSVSSIKKIEIFNNNLFILADNNLYTFSNDSLYLFETQVKDIKLNNKLIVLKDLRVMIVDKELKKSTYNEIVNFPVLVGDSLWFVDNYKIINLFSQNSINVNTPYDISSGNLSFANNILWVTNKTYDYSSGFYYYNTLSNNWQNVLLNTTHRIYPTLQDTIYIARWGYGARKYHLKNDSLIFVKDYTTRNTPFKGIDIDTNFFVISDIKQDNKNNIWFLSYLSLNRIQLGVEVKNRFYMFPMNNFPSLTEFNTLYIDLYRNKWIGTNNNGLILFNENDTYDNTNDDININITTTDGLNSNYVTSIAMDNNLELWVGTTAGINIISNINNPKNSIRKVWGMRNQSINQIIVDNASRKWVATKTGGLFLLSPDGYDIIYNFTTENSPLTSNNILSIALDEKKGIIYISTTNGIFSVQTPYTKSEDNFALKVFPNPFNYEKHNSVIIDGLTSNSTIKIFNTSMELIREINNINSGRYIWDGKDANGKKLSSGIYLIFASDINNNVSSTKIAVIK